MGRFRIDFPYAPAPKAVQNLPDKAVADRSGCMFHLSVSVSSLRSCVYSRNRNNRQSNYFSSYINHPLLLLCVHYPMISAYCLIPVFYRKSFLACMIEFVLSDIRYTLPVKFPFMQAWQPHAGLIAKNGYDISSRLN